MWMGDGRGFSMLMKKLGNASNELGKFYLGTRHDYIEAFRWFERGCKIFTEIEGACVVRTCRCRLCVLVTLRS